MENYETIKKMSKEEIVKEFNGLSKTTLPGLSFWRQELFYRESEELNKEMLRITKRIFWFTLIMVFLTVVNVVTFIFK